MLIDGVDFLPILLTKESLSIIKKIYNNKISKVSFNTKCELHKTTKKHLINECNHDFIYPIRHTASHTNLCSKIKHSLSDKKKIY